MLPMGYCIFILSRERKKLYEGRNQDNRGPLVRHALGCIVFAFSISFICLAELLLQVSTRRVWVGKIGMGTLVCTIGWIGGMDGNTIDLSDGMMGAGLARSVVL